MGGVAQDRKLVTQTQPGSTTALMIGRGHAFTGGAFPGAIDKVPRERLQAHHAVMRGE